jgi:hypothetical protein
MNAPETHTPTQPGKNGEFYTKGNVVWKSPIVRRNEADNGNSVEMGFAVCTASEWLSAETLAGALNEHVSLAARAAELETALRTLLNCPAIADEDHSDPAWGDEETLAAADAARAALKNGGGNV